MRGVVYSQYTNVIREGRKEQRKWQTTESTDTRDGRYGPPHRYLNIGKDVVIAITFERVHTDGEGKEHLFFLRVSTKTEMRTIM